jgi:hypothetical protein
MLKCAGLQGSARHGAHRLPFKLAVSWAVTRYCKAVYRNGVRHMRLASGTTCITQGGRRAHARARRRWQHVA